MPENWAAVVSDVRVALASVGKPVTLEIPGATTGPAYDPVIGTPTLEAVTALDERIAARDRDGLITGTQRVLTIAANQTRPVKGWRVQIGVTWHRIAEVMPLEPGDTALMYQIVLEA